MAKSSAATRLTHTLCLTRNLDMNLHISLTAGAIASLLLCATNLSADDQPPNETDKPIVSWSGANSKIKTRQVLRISTDEQWIALWLQHTGKHGDATSYDAWSNKAEIPTIDFSRNMVIAIFDGSGVNCAGLTDASITHTAKELIIRFDFKSYGTDGDAADGSDGSVDVAPFGLYVVSKSDKPITLQFPEPGPKDANPSGNWETYGRIAGSRHGITK